MTYLLLVAFAAPPAIELDGVPCERRWSEFVRHWFDFFDRDHDGKLSRAEAAAIPALPDDDGKPVAVDFAGADRDHDGSVSRAEFAAYYEAKRVRAVTVAPPTADTEAMELSNALLRLLDRDGDGTLSSAEIGRASAVLDAADADEDERVTAAELLAAVETKAKKPVSVTKAPPTLSDLSFSTAGIKVAGFQRLSASTFIASSPSHRVVVDTSALGAGDIVAGRKFLVGKWTTALGDDAAMTLASATTNAGFADLRTSLSSLDSDGDGRLSAAELGRYADLLAEGAAARVHVVRRFRGANWFDHWDRDHDGRLSSAELADPPRGPPPASWRCEFHRGPLDARFAQLRIAHRAVADATSRPAASPAWFTAMDRDGDGRVSAAEFIGRPERFKRLDRNADGFIDPAEIPKP